MIAFSSRRFVLPLACCAAMWVWAAPAAPVNEGAPAQVEQLARELADDKYAVREKATEELWKLGTSAMPRLKELTRSKDPEQAIRARELVRKIGMGLFPDSDPELLDIVNRYPTALPSEKNTMIRELQNRRAWKQMLKLHQEETNEAVRNQYLSTMQRIAVYAAREMLSKGDAEEALSLLELAPKTPESLLALAHFHRAQGTIEAELKKAEGLQDADAAAWRLALHRAAGDMRAALSEVDSSKEPLLAAALSALSGDPVPWLQLRSQDDTEKDVRRTLDEARKLYAGLAIDRWRGAPFDPAELGKLKKIQENRSSEYRKVARTALFMLGEHDVAEASLISDAPMMAVYYYLTLERVEDALKLMGHTVERPCTEEWVRDQFKNMDEDAFEDFDQSTKAQSLMIMAGFLESRGLHDLAYQCFHKPTLEFAAREKTAFLNFLMKLFNENNGFLAAPKLAIQLSVAWAKDDDDRWGSLVDAFWAGDDDSHEWWKLLGKINPDSSREKRLEVVLILSRRLPGEKGERQQWIDLVWKHYQQSEGQEKGDALQRLIDLAFNTGDVELSEKVWPEMTEELRGSFFWRQQISHLSAKEKWDEVCKVLLEQVAKMEAKQGGAINPAFHAYAASSLRRAGRLKEAQHHDRMADLLSLGDSSMCMQIALAYAFGDDYERSRIWWERAAQSTPPDGGMFSMAVSAYADAFLLEQSKWPLIAALNEVASCESIEANYYEAEVPLRNMRSRLKADTYRALSQLKQDRRSSVALLERCHQNFKTDGVLADFFFPALRQAGLQQEHDRWFDESWVIFDKVLKQFPDCANSQNTASWFASRAQRQLDAAESHQLKALADYPDQPAYLDTMAELQFAKGNRKEAMKWSRKAILLAPSDTELRRQFHHFENDPLPK